MAFTYSLQAHRNSSSLYAVPSTYGTMTQAEDRIQGNNNSGGTSHYSSGSQHYVIVPSSNTGGTIYLFMRGWLHTGKSIGTYYATPLSTSGATTYLYGYTNSWNWYINGVNVGTLYTGTSNETNTTLNGNLYLKGSSYNQWRYLASCNITWTDGTTQLPYYRGAGSGSYISEYTGWASTSSASPAYYTIPTYTIQYHANGGSSTPANPLPKYKGIDRTITLASAITKADSDTTVLRSVKYVFLNGEADQTVTVQVPAHVTYTFKGWLPSGSVTTYQPGATFTYTTDAALTISAQGESNYTYPTTGGTTTLLTPTREGYVCVGWSHTKGVTSAEYLAGSEYRPSKGNDTLYAVWAPLININISSAGKAGTPGVNINGVWKKGVVGVNVDGTGKTKQEIIDPTAVKPSYWRCTTSYSGTVNGSEWALVITTSRNYNEFTPEVGDKIYLTNCAGASFQISNYTQLAVDSVNGSFQRPSGSSISLIPIASNKIGLLEVVSIDANNKPVFNLTANEPLE